MKFLHAKRHTLKSTQGGFIALISTVILLAVLMMVIVSSSTSSFFARFDALGSEFKRRSLGLSEACTNAALLELTKNYDYAGDETKNVGADTCYIDDIKILSQTSSQKTVEVKTSAKYPEQNGAWSTNEIVATIQNPSVSLLVPPPTCALNSTTPVLAGKPLQIGWALSSNATAFTITGQGIATPPTISSTSPITITAPSSTGDVTYTGTVSNTAGSTQCTTVVTVLSPPPSPSCADTVMMMDRTNSTSGFQTQMGNAIKALLNLYNTLSPTPQVGIGDYGAVTETNKNLYGSSYNFYAEIPNGPVGASPTILISGLLTNNYGSESTVFSTQNSNTLFPDGQGFYDIANAWNGGEGAIDETVTPSCSASDSINENVTGDRESVKINLSTIPNGSIVKSVQVYVWDVANTVIGGSYQTFVRVGTTNTDSGTDLNTTSLSGCTQRFQNIDIPDFTKSSTSTLEIGVLKTATNTNNVRVGAIRAVITYDEPTFISTRLYKTATEIYAHGTSGGGTSNLSDGVRVGNIELNRTTPITDITGVVSNGHDTTKEKVLIFVADGKPDFPKNGLPQNNIPECNSLTSDSGKRYACEQLYKMSDEAKLSGTKIFSIYFGSTNAIQQNIMAQISSGSDYFFISPTAEAMAGIFETVGRLACPALAPACSNTIDDDADGFTDEADPACHVGNVMSGTYDPNDNDEWTASPPPSPPPPPPPPPPISIGSWDEIINITP